MAGDDFDQTDDPIAGLADQIADRVALRLVQQFSRLAVPARGTPAPEQWSARRVASYYGVAVSFVYQHADELGCIRLGGGSCARLRFDPATVQARWSQVGALPAERPQRQRSKQSRRPRTHQRGEDLLLEFEREP